jgi:ribosome biogenesis GTPase / thiamine phosphate phosphatase
MPKARIIKIISNQYTVFTEDGERLLAIAMGKLRLKKSPVVGDWVLVDELGDKWGIQHVEERFNELTRPLIANVDQAMIVTSLIQPDFSPILLDRLIFLISYANIEPVIVVTKCDLLPSDDPVYQIIAEYQKAGYKVLFTGRDMPVDNIKAALKGKVTVLTGQSGAGKSSLINRIDGSFELITQEISKALGRGKHTTRHSELHYVADGWVADTPGFSSLDFSMIDKDIFRWIVPDFKPYMGKCKFRNCMHENEPGCAVKEAVSKNEVSKIRYENYVECLKMIEEERKPL